MWWYYGEVCKIIFFNYFFIMTIYQKVIVFAVFLIVIILTATFYRKKVMSNFDNNICDIIDKKPQILGNSRTKFEKCTTKEWERFYQITNSWIEWERNYNFLDKKGNYLWSLNTRKIKNFEKVSGKVLTWSCEYINFEKDCWIQ